MAHDLSGATLKLQRAYFHHVALCTAIERVRETYPEHPTVLFQEVDAQTRQMAFAIDLDPPPQAWAALIGDFLHNAHSALDHLYWELLRRRNYGHEPPEGTRANFPIFKNRGRFWRKGKNGDWTGQSGAAALRRVPGDARRLILEVQPYKNGNRAPEHPLWMLHTLSNTDKHKTLHYVQQAVLTGGYTVASQRNVRIGAFNAHSGVLPPGGRVIGTLQFTELSDDAYLQVEPEFSLAETFTEAGPASGHFIAGITKQVIEYVTNDVFAERFWPYFGVDPAREIQAITNHPQA